MQIMDQNLLGYETQMAHDSNAIAFNELTGNFEQVAEFTPFIPNYKLNTFTFESPRIPIGSAKHYNVSTLGHSRTYTTTNEPKVLYVMESQSDWGQTKFKDNLSPYTGTTKYLNDPIAYRKFIDGHKRLLAKMQENPSDYQAGAIEKQIANIEHHEAILKQILGQGRQNPQAKYLHDNYLQRQLQENLRYAAENGQTKMRYPTSETAAKIEGYTPAKQPSLRELSDAVVQELKSSANAPTPYSQELFDLRQKLLKLTDQKEINRINSQINRIQKIEDRWKSGEITYPSNQETILDKYSDFPKLFQKLFKDQKVRTVTDTKGNTWYEVDVPKGYLNREWQFKQGGKML